MTIKMFLLKWVAHYLMELMEMNRPMPVGVRLSVLSRAFRRRLDEKLLERGLTGVQFSVLGQLIRMENEGGTEISQKDLERVRRVTHPTMTEIIKRLEKKELIRCETSGRDRRRKRVISTEKARCLLGEVGLFDQEVFLDLSAGLSPEEVEQFLNCVDVMLKNAAECCGKGCDEDCGKDPCKEPEGI